MAPDFVNEIEHYAIFRMDAEGRVVTWNEGAKQIKGYTGEEILGTHYRTFFPPEAVEQRTPDQLLARAEVEGAVQGQGWRIRKDGSQFWADFTLTALYDESDTLCGYAKVTKDQTETREHEQQLKRQNEQLEQFARVLSHDIQNPLNAAQLQLDLAAKECDSEHIDAAVDSLERSFEIVADALTLVRDSGDDMTLEDVHLAETVKRCWQNIDATTGSLIPKTERTIRADTTRLQRLLDNLLANAVEHGGEGVVVTVGDLEDGFFVADNGSGIPEDERDRVFEKGYSTSEGTGLGLGIVHECATDHEWEIELTDSDTGGARFEMRGVGTTDE